MSRQKSIVRNQSKLQKAIAGRATENNERHRIKENFQPNDIQVHKSATSHNSLSKSADSKTADLFMT